MVKKKDVSVPTKVLSLVGIHSTSADSVEKKADRKKMIENKIKMYLHFMSNTKVGLYLVRRH